VQTRRDQVQAYRFAQTRMQSALLTGEPDRVESPLRRPGVATFAGVMVSVLVICGFGIYGLVRPANKKGWNERGVLVVERETGTRFVFDARDDALHPVLNYTSARLLLNSRDVTVKEFSRASLAGVRRGSARGLAGLPDALPAAGGLVRGPWVVCSTAGQPGDTSSLSVSVASQPTGQHITGERGVLVRSEDDKVYLVWNDTRLLVPDPKIVLPALGLDGTTPMTVASNWLNSVAAGPDLKPPLPLDIGSAVPYEVGSQAVYLGQVFKVVMEGGVGAGYYVVLKDGLAKITNLVALLLLGDPTLKYAYGMQSPHAYTVQSADVNAAPKASAQVAADGFPRDVPQLAEVPVDGHGRPVPPALCAAYTDLSGNSVSSAVYVSDSVPGATGGAVPSAGQRVRVLMPPGTACLARSLPHAGQGSDAVFLVTDLGARYPVPSGDVQAALGYGGVTPVPVPEGILELVPSGPTLDPNRVNLDQPVPGPATTEAG
jgi:type VII secretion protein EccB